MLRQLATSSCPSKNCRPQGKCHGGCQWGDRMLSRVDWLALSAQHMLCYALCSKHHSGVRFLTKMACLAAGARNGRDLQIGAGCQ